MEILTTVIAIPLVNFLVDWAKKKFNLSWEVTLVIVSLFIWALYTLLKTYSPETFIEEAHEFVAQVGFYAVLVYEFIIKKKIYQ